MLLRSEYPVKIHIIDGRKYVFTDKDFWTLAELETHHIVMKNDIDFHTDDATEMFGLFKKSLESLPRSQIFLIAKLNKKIVGFVGIHCSKKHGEYLGEVGICVHPDHWGKGFGTALLKEGIENARKKRLTKLEAETLASNIPMLRIADKVGFQLVCVRKKWASMHKEYEDVAHLAMIL